MKVSQKRQYCFSLYTNTSTPSWQSFQDSSPHYSSDNTFWQQWMILIVTVLKATNSASWCSLLVSQLLACPLPIILGVLAFVASSDPIQTGQCSDHSLQIPSVILRLLRFLNHHQASLSWKRRGGRWRCLLRELGADLSNRTCGALWYLNHFLLALLVHATLIWNRTLSLA